MNKELAGSRDFSRREFLSHAAVFAMGKFLKLPSPEARVIYAGTNMGKTGGGLPEMNKFYGEVAPESLPLNEFNYPSYFLDSINSDPQTALEMLGTIEAKWGRLPFRVEMTGSSDGGVDESGKILTAGESWGHIRDLGLVDLLASKGLVPKRISFDSAFVARNWMHGGAADPNIMANYFVGFWEAYMERFGSVETGITHPVSYTYGSLNGAETTRQCAQALGSALKGTRLPWPAIELDAPYELYDSNQIKETVGILTTYLPGSEIRAFAVSQYAQNQEEYAINSALNREQFLDTLGDKCQAYIAQGWVTAATPEAVHKAWRYILGLDFLG